MAVLMDLTGQRFGRLTAIKYSGCGVWAVKCDCGREHSVSGKHLRKQSIRSCGCLKVERDRERAVESGLAANNRTRDRFMSHVQITDFCWIWTASTFRHGYGKFRGPGPDHKSLQAHRVSYELFIGPIAAGMVVCHRCDKPTCVNPDHLFQGTVQDNVRDCWSKGRSGLQRKRSNKGSSTAQVTNDSQLTAEIYK